MRIRLENKKAGIEAVSLIANLILAIIAFSFMISFSSGVVSGQEQEPTTPTAGSWLSKQFLDESYKSVWWRLGGGVLDAVLSGAQWAGIAYGAGQLIGSMLGLQEGARNSISYTMAAGFGVFKLISVGGQKGGFLANMFSPSTGAALPTWAPWVGGIAAGLLILILTYKEESKKIVSFECQPWEAPVGGNDCEKCNSDLYPCTEYRCRSLGQACQLLNAGTGQEKCAWVNPKDVNSPIIQTSAAELTKEHSYSPNTAIRPPDRGVKIIYNKATDGCVKAFTPLTFGISLNEPAQCRIDYNRTSKYDDMQYYFGGSNIYKYNHTQTLSLPGPDSINAEAPELKADGTYNLYVRCKDANGNENNDLFVFSFCVEKGPDVTPPTIQATSIANNMPFQAGLKQTALEVYVNEPADCKWSKTDLGYEDMETSMTCSQHIYEMNNQMLYKCTTTLTDLEDKKDNVFYFKCKDQPWLGEIACNKGDRNCNQDSYKFTLKGTQLLNINDNSIKPNGTIKGSGTLATVYLELETENGYNKGDAWCSYFCSKLDSFPSSLAEDDYIKMLETGSNKHKQRQDLDAGSWKCSFQCVDLGGNTDYATTTFTVVIDETPPIVTRVYKSGNSLRIITDEKSSCSYSNNNEKKCNFEIAEGLNMPYANSTEHDAPWENINYYIKCQDVNGKQPSPTECSIIVKPY